MATKTPASKEVKKAVKKNLKKPTIITTGKVAKAGKAKASAQPAKRGAAYHRYRKNAKRVSK
jgi:hypothetical protein